MASPKIIKVSVLSDITCPWCFIGAREIDRAIERVRVPPGKAVKFDIEHKPFFLNPTLPPDEVQRTADYVADRLGVERWKQARALMEERCKELNMRPLNHDGYFFSTWRAHRLLAYAWNKRGPEVQRRLLYALFEGTFYRCEKLNDIDLLAKYAQDAGVMSKAEAVAFLRSDKLQKEVQAMVAIAQRNGVSGVPFALIEGRWAISGGQSAEVFYNIFQKLANGQEP